MEIEIAAAQTALNQLERRARELGVRRIPQMIDRLLDQAGNEAAALFRESVRGRLDVPEPKTLRSIISTKTRVFRDEATGGMRISGPAGAYLRPLIMGGVRLPSDGLRRIYVPLKKPLQSPEAKRAGINARFNASGNLNRNDQKALMGLGRPSGARKPYTRATSRPSPQGVFWGTVGARFALYLRPERVVRGNRVVNAGRPRVLVLALRQARYEPVLQSALDNANRTALARLPARAAVALARLENGR